MRIILAGIAGGIAMFIWSFCCHTVLPLGEVGVKMLPNEPPLMAALRPPNICSTVAAPTSAATTTNISGAARLT